MTEETEPNVWHYGLMAERWAEFIHDTPELPFYQDQIKRFGEPVLDLGCGTGRLLLPLLKGGVDVDGCDVSADMIHHANRLTAEAGFTPNLYVQPMDGLDLPRRYRMIYICSSFGLAGSREQDQEALFRCYEHLNEGGALIVNITAEYAYPDAWQAWLKSERDALPAPWPEEAQSSTGGGWQRISSLVPDHRSKSAQPKLQTTGTH